MLQQLGTSLRVTILSVVLLGFIYPLAMTAIAQATFPREANGAMVATGGKVVGSGIIGQLWTKPYYFHGRPSAAGKNGYDPTATAGTNLGATSKKLIDATKATIAALKKENPDARGPLPIDLVTSSASGIDPDITPAAAYYQAPRVAKARGMAVATVNSIIARETKPRTWGILGEERVNVLALNLALDAAAPGSAAPGHRHR